MQTMKNVKIWLGLAYIIFLGLFLYFLLTYISIEELTSYSFLKSNSEYLINFKQNNIIFSSFVFIIFGIVWISLLQGFGSPLGLICGYIFGPYFGTLIFSFNGSKRQISKRKCGSQPIFPFDCSSRNLVWLSGHFRWS